MGVKAVQLLLDGKHEQELIIRDADVCAIPFGKRKSLSAVNFLAIYEKYLF